MGRTMLFSRILSTHICWAALSSHGTTLCYAAGVGLAVDSLREEGLHVLRPGDVGGTGLHLGAHLIRYLGGGLGEGLFAAASDHHARTFAGEFGRYRPPQPLARRHHQRDLPSSPRSILTPSLQGSTTARKKLSGTWPRPHPGSPPPPACRWRSRPPAGAS